ncbi:tyrosine-type recombinase/integrase [Desulfovibrio sp. ZJ200]|uniref:tyrosine-type recombinase/integrase n=1 Tax=Desulfovibrio sp. ZJ200 TaxID=2709792 RepID=UPI0013EE2017|nr:tyrosine-type recombinase/integrase [Desulfovibrio sp. ZJ200]
MATKTQSLELVIRNARGVRGDVQVIRCGAGLEMWISVNQAGTTMKKWVLRYSDAAGKRQKVRMGSYPELTLAKARATAEDLKEKAKAGLKPARENAKKQVSPIPRTFESVALAWLEKKTPEWDDAHAKRQKERLTGNIFPAFGDMDINAITMMHIDKALGVVIKRGARETAQRICSILINIFEYADLMGLLENPVIINRLTRYRKEMPKPLAKRHLYREMSEREIGLLLKALEDFKGRWTLQTSVALRLAPYVMLRPAEICEAKWEEINLETAEWYIPASRMKMSRDHIVPLPRQAVELFLEIRPFSGANTYVFPSPRKPNTPISTASLIQAIRRIGYASTREEGNSFCTHGFRGMASTTLNQHPKFQHLKHDWIEMQLAHVQTDKVRAAYNILSPRSYLLERRKMVQEYANYLDSLRMNAVQSSTMSQCVDMPTQKDLSQPTEGFASSALDIPTLIGTIKHNSQITVMDTGWSEEQKNRMRQFGYDDMDIVRAWYN